jgi:hypothetical protein
MKTQSKTIRSNSQLGYLFSFTKMEVETKHEVSFQKKIDSIIRELKHSKHITNKECCREFMERACFLIQDYNF